MSHLRVIEGSARRPVDRTEASIELEQAGRAAALIDQLHAIAHEHGPAAEQLVARLDVWHRQHARRWADAADAVLERAA